MPIDPRLGSVSVWASLLGCDRSNLRAGLRGSLDAQALRRYAAAMLRRQLGSRWRGRYRTAARTARRLARRGSWAAFVPRTGPGRPAGLPSDQMLACVGLRRPDRPGRGHQELGRFWRGIARDVVAREPLTRAIREVVRHRRDRTTPETPETPSPEIVTVRRAILEARIARVPEAVRRHRPPPDESWCWDDLALVRYSLALGVPVRDDETDPELPYT